LYAAKTALMYTWLKWMQKIKAELNISSSKKMILEKKSYAKFQGCQNNILKRILEEKTP